MATSIDDQFDLRAGLSFWNPKITTSKTATYQMLVSDGCVLPVDGSGGSFTVTLPPSGSTEFKNGCTRFIVCTANPGANTVTVAGSGADTVNGAATSTLLTGAARVTMWLHLKPGGTDWVILSTFSGSL